LAQPKNMPCLVIQKSGRYIDALVVRNMLWTYTSSKSGLSARKSESNSGDATISLRMVNEDTSWTCKSFILHVHTLDVLE